MAVFYFITIAMMLCSLIAITNVIKDTRFADKVSMLGIFYLVLIFIAAVSARVPLSYLALFVLICSAASAGAVVVVGIIGSRVNKALAEIDNGRSKGK